MEWLKAERQFLLDLTQQSVGLTNQRIAQLDEEIQSLETPAAPTIATALESELEALPWKAAQSGKCDYSKNVPLGLVQRVRSVKGGFVGRDHHFTAHKTDQTLFRFSRCEKK